MVSKGARSPAGSTAAKKEPPSATHGSLVVIEHRRTHETTVRCSLLALKSRTPSHTKAPRGPPFRPNACQNVGRVITSHGPPSDISHKQRNRAKAPPPAPQAPDPPFRSRHLAKAGPGGRGWGSAPDQPRPSLVQLNDIATNQKHSYVARPQAHHAGPLGAADFPCLRQLPPPP